MNTWGADAGLVLGPRQGLVLGLMYDDQDDLGMMAFTLSAGMHASQE